MKDLDQDAATIPRPDATWHEIAQYGLAFEAYEHGYSVAECAAIARMTEALFRETGTLPSSLPVLRVCLFVEQRRYHWLDTPPRAEEMAYIRTLLKTIHGVAAGRGVEESGERSGSMTTDAKEVQLVIERGALGRHVIDRCRWIIRMFVERDAYADYDFGESYVHPSQAAITRHHVYVMNSVMRARSPIASWEPILERPLAQLAALSEDLDLIDSDDAAVERGLVALNGLVRTIASQRGLTDMAASKVLYLLRPRFIAISDSYVREELGISDRPFAAQLGSADAATKAVGCAARMRAVQEAVRTLGSDNEEALNELHAYANSIGAVTPVVGAYRGKAIPVRLSKARILDILLWADVAIHGPTPHQFWSCASSGAANRLPLHSQEEDAGVEAIAHLPHPAGQY